MRLVENWKQAWRWFSVQSLALIVALPTVWAAMPADAKAFIPAGWGTWVLAGLAVAGLIGRLIDQEPK